MHGSFNLQLVMSMSLGESV